MIGSLVVDEACIYEASTHLLSHDGYGFDSRLSRKLDGMLAPGDFVRHPGRPDWGLGQIQSIIGHRVTVNFENAGKLLIDSRAVELQPAEPTPFPPVRSSRNRG